MKDVLATATMFTGFAGLVATVVASASFIGSMIIMPAFMGLADYAMSIDVSPLILG
jgi:hypothetical protein